MTARLIQLSGVVVDHIYRVEAVPLPGTEARVYSARLTPGGGLNAMVAARRAGMAVAYGGTLGTGPFADLVAAAMAAEGIGILRPRLEGQDQGCCTVLIDRTGERTFIALEGADGQIGTADLALIRPDPQDWLLLSGYALCYAGSRLALTHWLQQPRDLPLVFDPSPLVDEITPATLRAAMAAARWVSANGAEAQTLTGKAVPAEAAAALAAGRSGGAVVRVGADGCYLAQPGAVVHHIPGYPVTAVDTNGAGDAHIGAFIAALSRGETPVVAARLANMAAALAVTQEGPSTAPTLDAVLAALAAGNHSISQQRS